VQAILDALKEINVNVSTNIEKVRLKEFSFKNKKIDLLDPYYWVDYYFTWEPHSIRSSFYKEIRNYSKFYLLVKKNDDVNLQLVHRIPDICDCQEIHIEINGKKLGSLLSSNQWKCDYLRISQDLLIDNVNRIIIYWPLNNIDLLKDKGLDEDPLPILMKKKMRPVTGEIHSFMAFKEN
jgi:hypothetical protein